ncbi:MAG TPA: hypothetical protein VLX91_00625 [Candidatus Acidoferrales bacterium]|nr:hypothetical protein [Candidatus Acidoferrales bacterium]
MVRAKCRVTKVTKTVEGSECVSLVAVYDDGIEENKRFAKATPAGSIELWVDNPPASDYLKLGEYFYVDFTKCEQTE